MTRTSESADPSDTSTPVATAVALPSLPRDSEKLHQTRRVRSKSSRIATSRSPPCPCATTFGTPRMGSDRLPSARTWRIRPPRSVTSQLPSGNSAMPHGFSSPSARTVVINCVSSLIGGARVCPWNAGCWPEAFGGAALKSCADVAVAVARKMDASALREARIHRAVWFHACPCFGARPACCSRQRGLTQANQGHRVVGAYCIQRHDRSKVQEELWRGN